MSGQARGQVGAESNLYERFDATIKQRGLSNFEVAMQLGVTDKTVLRWRRGEVRATLIGRRAITAWIESEPVMPEAA